MDEIIKTLPIILPVLCIFLFRKERIIFGIFLGTIAFWGLHLLGQYQYCQNPETICLADEEQIVVIGTFFVGLIYNVLLIGIRAVLEIGLDFVKLGRFIKFGRRR